MANPQAIIILSLQSHACQLCQKTNIIIPEQESPKLDKAGKTYIEQVVGSFLYYAHTIDMTILHVLRKIASPQTNLPREPSYLLHNN